MSCEKNRAREIRHKFQRCLARLAREKADFAADLDAAGVDAADLDAAELPEDAELGREAAGPRGQQNQSSPLDQPQPLRGILLRA